MIYGADLNCEKIWSGGATVYVYCPKSFTYDELAKKAAAYSALYFNNQMNQVHLYFFNNKKLAPKNSAQFSKISDKVFFKIQTGIYDKNSNSGHESFQCQDNGKLYDCTSRLK